MRAKMPEVLDRVMQQLGPIQARSAQSLSLVSAQPIVIERMRERRVAHGDVGHSADGAVTVLLRDTPAPVASDIGIVPDRLRLDRVGGHEFQVVIGHRRLGRRGSGRRLAARGRRKKKQAKDDRQTVHHPMFTPRPRRGKNDLRRLIRAARPLL